MWQKESGIILSSVRHNDKSCVVRIFTEGHGCVSYIFFLSQSGKGTARNTLLQPLTQIEFQGQNVPTANLQHMREAKNAYPYADIPFNPVKSTIALFLGEFLSYALAGESENRLLYRFVSASLEWLDSAGSVSNFHISFMLQVASYLGICPNADEYQPGYWLDLAGGSFTAAMPNHSNAVSPEVAYKLYLVMQQDYQGAETVPLTRTERSSLLAALSDWYRLHVPGFPTLKSLEVLQAIFDWTEP